jgi:S-adenosylmethionine decarboxylase
LGMDLTRSSTAQKEDHGETAQVAHNLEPVSGRHVDRSNVCIERPRVHSASAAQSAGSHLIVDLYAASKLDDLKHIEQTLKRCVQVAGATLQHIHLQRFTPNGGVSGVAVMAGSHISIYSWPESGYATLDLFMPGEGKAELCVGELMQAFSASKVVVKANRHGEDAEMTETHIAAAVHSGQTMRPARARVRTRKAA